MRDAGQHPDANDRPIHAAERLGVRYRPTNWTAAWQRISTLATNAQLENRRRRSLVPRGRADAWLAESAGRGVRVRVDRPVSDGETSDRDRLEAIFP